MDLCIPIPPSVPAQSSAAEPKHKCLEPNETGSAASVIGADLLHPVASDVFTPHTTVDVSSVGWSALWFFFLPSILIHIP